MYLKFDHVHQDLKKGNKMRGLGEDSFSLATAYKIPLIFSLPFSHRSPDRTKFALTFLLLRFREMTKKYSTSLALRGVVILKFGMSG